MVTFCPYPCFDKLSYVVLLWTLTPVTGEAILTNGTTKMLTNAHILLLIYTSKHSFWYSLDQLIGDPMCVLNRIFLCIWLHDLVKEIKMKQLHN